MSAFEEIADRRIRAGYEAGLFDDLEGAGKPIRDIDTIRPPGWWAARLAARERSKLRAEDLASAIADAMPSVWREPDESAVRAHVDRLNARIDDYNAGTSWERHDRLDAASIVERWRRLDRYRRAAGDAEPS
ncbi:MAG: DnaJ family domain-containing protein [Actinomycetota bacterium]